MLFNSMEFMVFFPTVCLGYYIIPHRVRYIFLLVCSYFFYMCWNPRYALLILTSTVITYVSGLLLDYVDRSSLEQNGSRLPKSGTTENSQSTFSDVKLQRAQYERKKLRRKKICVALSFVSNLAILFFFKYFNFAADSVVRVLGFAGIQVQAPAFDVILPVGISFYTFQALSYTMDVYRKDIYAEKNFMKYALFVSFFPQLVAGPIERSRNLLIQINEKHKFDFERVRSGLLLMLYGYFQKVVLAERIAVVVDRIFDTYLKRTGFQLTVAAVLFAFQIYCDFASYSNIAAGAARVMGFSLMENFNTPYFAVSVADFWRRWHISLSSWFKDYLYFPLGGSRKGKLKKYRNVMIVFLVSGLWHGASWHFVVWGFMNGAYQVIGEWLKPVKEKLVRVFHIRTEEFSHRLLRLLTTFVLVDISWIFFRNPLRKSAAILSRIAGLDKERWFTWGNNLKAMRLTIPDRNLLLISLAVLFFVDICKYKKINLNDWICRQGMWLRWLIYFAGIFAVLIFGVYGPGYDAGQFIYFQF